MRTTLLGLLLLAPMAAAASGNCNHSAPRELALDLAGVKTVRVETQEHDVRLRAAPGASHALQGRACASQPVWILSIWGRVRRRRPVLLRYACASALPRSIFATGWWSAGSSRRWTA